MNLKIFFSLTFILTFVLSGCTYYNEYQQRKHFVGLYEHSFARPFSDDGLRGIAEFHTIDKLNFTGIENSTDIAITFFFSDNIEFSNITLNYKSNIKGKWHLNRNVMSFEVDTSSFKYEFVSSSAKRYIEQTMVRYLRKYIFNDVMKQVDGELIDHYQQSFIVDSLTDSLLVFRNDNDVLELKRLAE